MNIIEPIKTELFKNIDSFINEIELCFNYTNTQLKVYIENIKSNTDDMNIFVNKTHLHLHQFEKEMSVILFSNKKIRTPAYNFMDNIVLFEDSEEPLQLLTFTNENKNTKKSFLKYIYNIYMSCFFINMNQNKGHIDNELTEFISKIISESQIPTVTQELEHYPDPHIETIGIKGLGDLNSLMSSIMGNTDIMNIANEISAEMSNETINPMDLMANLMSGNMNNGPLGILMNKIQTSVDAKITNGEINQSVLEEQAKNIITQMQNTGLTDILQPKK